MKRWIVDRELSSPLSQGERQEVDRGQRVIFTFLKERGEEVDRGQRVILLSQGER